MTSALWICYKMKLYENENHFTDAAKVIEQNVHFVNKYIDRYTNKEEDSIDELV